MRHGTRVSLDVQCQANVHGGQLVDKINEDIGHGYHRTALASIAILASDPVLVERILRANDGHRRQ